jgi:predicted ATPase
MLIWTRTGGNPLFTVELLSDLQEHHGVIRDQGGCLAEAPVLSWQRLPPRVEAVIAEQIARLPSGWQSMLKAAAVEGEVFTAEVLARLDGRNTGETLTLHESQLGRKHRLVQSDGVAWVNGQRLTRYRFRCRLVQKYLNDHLEGGERMALHAAVCGALEELTSGRKN